jgi:hypothetical protein
VIWKARSDRDPLLGKRSRRIVLRGIATVAMAVVLIVIRTEATALLLLLKVLREGRLMAIPVGRGVHVSHRN